MARIRSIKPEFWDDRRLATRVSRDARLLYIALWNQADEWARVHGDPRWVKGQCLPYDDDINLADVEDLLTELAGAGVVQRYDVDGDPYLYLPKLAAHQRLEPDKVPSRLPEPPPLSESRADSSESRADLPERRADSPETNCALQVAGSREQVAGGTPTRASAQEAQTTRMPSQRSPDPLWDALLAACGINTRQVTHSAHAGYRRAAAQLAAVGATPQQVHERAAHYRQRWPKITLTPGGLAKHWPALEHPPQAAEDPMWERAMARALSREVAS